MVATQKLTNKRVYLVRLHGKGGIQMGQTLPFRNIRQPSNGSHSPYTVQEILNLQRQDKIVNLLPLQKDNRIMENELLPQVQ